MLILGIVFRFYNPIAALIFLLVLIAAVCAEILEKPTPSTHEGINRKYSPRKSLEQRQAEYDRDLANRMKSRGMAPTTPQNSKYAAKYKKLVAMLAGDRVTADRLIATFGIDKAISDLERDRRAN
ncbi:hypothetical protein H6F42_15900 [Pseudanabaena sp. FACHB-1998]|uniref:hypothetical protein n=1 Tax=Pseudanabaena sp. FACHB-1998 TaxID=2692858 RepID=UPI001681BCAD|nr:hypothetical protein [Pseudanabaena sp. FACHB-1998]MBD2178403.1 hypothetical protein [Pseudanabaena sp. FACHB-1998]